MQWSFMHLHRVNDKIFPSLINKESLNIGFWHLSRITLTSSTGHSSITPAINTINSWICIPIYTNTTTPPRTLSGSLSSCMVKPYTLQTSTYMWPQKEHLQIMMLSHIIQIKSSPHMDSLNVYFEAHGSKQHHPKALHIKHLNHQRKW